MLRSAMRCGQAAMIRNLTLAGAIHTVLAMLGIDVGLIQFAATSVYVMAIGYVLITRYRPVSGSQPAPSDLTEPG